LTNFLQKKITKKSSKFVYFLAKQRKSPFNLTIFFNNLTEF